MNLIYLILLLLFGVVSWSDNRVQESKGNSLKLSEAFCTTSNAKLNVQADEDEYTIFIDSFIESNNALIGNKNIASFPVATIKSIPYFNKYLTPFQLDLPPPVCS